MKLTNKVFNKKTKVLPTIAEWQKEVIFDIDSYMNGERSVPKTLDIRNECVSHCFTILSHEFLESLKKFCSQFNNISEVGCGEGWLSYWMKQYGIKMHSSVDDLSWDFHKEYFDFIIEDNAENYIKENSDIDLIIMSWPNYDEPFAYRIWNNMKKGQHLLYIGEGGGGCTADDDFHDAIFENEVKDIWGLNENFRAFWGIHDRPFIYKK